MPSHAPSPLFPRLRPLARLPACLPRNDFVRDYSLWTAASGLYTHNWSLGFPLLFSLGAVAIGVAAGLSAERLRRDKLVETWSTHGRCIHCGYNLNANTTGICPECGVHIATTA